jgi:hypothetical protein
MVEFARECAHTHRYGHAFGAEESDFGGIETI